MWVLLSLKRMDEIVITKCIKDIYNEFRKPIYLSINSYKNFNETKNEKIIGIKSK